MRVPWEYEEPACAEIGGDLWFPDKGEEALNLNMVRGICNSCTHKAECLEWGIANEPHGIWGGTGASERKRMRRKKQRVKPN